MKAIRKAIGLSVVGVVLAAGSPVFVEHDLSQASDPVIVEHDLSQASIQYVEHDLG